MTVYVLSQLVRVRAGRAQLTFAREAAAALAGLPGVATKVSKQGLEVLATDEDALRTAIAWLGERYGRRLLAFRPQVVCADAAEPVMRVRVVTQPDYAQPVKRSLRRRGAELLSAKAREGDVEIVALAPQSNIIGFGRELTAISWNTALLEIVFSHYDRGERAAAGPPPAAARTAVAAARLE